MYDRCFAAAVAGNLVGEPAASLIELTVAYAPDIHADYAM
jgi:hypothetical protein